MLLTWGNVPEGPPWACFSMTIVMITLDLEISLVWSQSKKRPAFYLFIFNRFFAFFFLIFDSIPLTKAGTNSSHVWISTTLLFLSFCVIYLMCDDLVTLLTTLTVQAILMLRVYALYERSRKILVFLLTVCLLELAAMATLVGVTIKHLDHILIASTDTGCYYHGILKFSALFWVPGLVYEPILFLMVAYKAWPLTKGNKGPRIPLVTRMARDSLFYFVIVFALLLISTLIWARAPTYINMVMPWSAALPSILGSRLLLNMREIVSRQMNGSYIIESFAGNQTIPFRNPSSTFEAEEESELATLQDA
ncbi:unnamed protein product [Somion occarium]|uniref:DUF6533 domain-containing protein n=1 Tax=Somion occarium TaxID=3059160 RepID=A0ABP1CJG4_9APHY